MPASSGFHRRRFPTSSMRQARDAAAQSRYHLGQRQERLLRPGHLHGLRLILILHQQDDIRADQVRVAEPRSNHSARSAGNLSHNGSGSYRGPAGYGTTSASGTDSGSPITAPGGGIPEPAGSAGASLRAAISVMAASLS